MNDHALTANCLLKQAKLFLKSLRSGPLAIAVSGGSDSLGVLLAICEANCSDRDIICLTVNHGLRAEAIAEAEFVGEVCKTLGVKHEVLNWVDEKPKLGIQNAARQARYKLLADACAKNNAIGLVTGHTQDDQLETVTMRARRNTSDAARGLSGMAPATLFFNQMWVLRPFLNTAKTEFQQFLETRNQTWIEDPSNQDDSFERVRVRKQAEFASSLPEIAVAQELRLKIGIGAAEYLSKYCSVRDGLIAEIHVEINNTSFLLRALESLIDVIGGRNRTLSNEQMDKLALFIRSENPKPITLGRTLIKKQSGALVLQRENRSLDAIEVLAHSSVIWDGRFKVENKHQEKHLFVTCDSDINGFPPKVFWMTDVMEDQVEVNGKASLISVSRYLNRFDEVLSLFDMPLAVEVANLFESHEFKVRPFASDL